MSQSDSSLVVGTVKETFPGERRVAIVPSALKMLVKTGAETVIEAGAGIEAGFADDEFSASGARIENDRDAVFSAADILFQVRAAGANADQLARDLNRYRAGQVVIGACDPLSSPDSMAQLAERGVTCFALEMLPRITRAQAMDILSSMATVAGYKAVLMAADALPRMFPMLMTAAGTVTPARVFIVGAGVAGLQAIATARRLGAVVQAYDLRPAVREEVESLGGEFVDLPLETGASGESGGYAREMNEEFYQKQRELMQRVVAESDVVITTAAVPGKTAPVLVTEEMVAGMRPGSVIVDLAAERGGNCALTIPGETVEHSQVKILGPLNVPSTVPYHASQMYARNLANFLKSLIGSEGQLDINLEDEVIRETLICRDGEVVHPAVRERLGLAPLETSTSGDA